MIAAELRGGNKPSLNEALGWIGSRVDDIYGANVGRLEDVWIDPGTGAPRWLLVKEGRFGGRTTLIPFEDATAGAGHVWVPYEREIVREAPEIEPGAPLTQQVEAALRSHYAANVPPAIAHAGPQGAGQEPAPQRQPADPPEPPATTATLRFATGGAQPTPPPSFGAPGPPPPAEEQPRTEYRPPAPTPRRPVLREQPAQQLPPAPPQSAAPQGMPPGLPPRPAPPIAAPQPQPQAQPNPYAYQAPPQPPPGYAYPPQGYAQPQPQPQPQPYQYPPAPRPAPPQVWQQPPAPPQSQPNPNPIEMLNSLASSSQVHYVEIELSGELSIRGELRSVRVIPRDQGPGYGA